MDELRDSLHATSKVCIVVLGLRARVMRVMDREKLGARPSEWVGKEGKIKTLCLTNPLSSFPFYFVTVPPG